MESFLWLLVIVGYLIYRYFKNYSHQQWCNKVLKEHEKQFNSKVATERNRQLVEKMNHK